MTMVFGVGLDGWPDVDRPAPALEQILALRGEFDTANARSLRSLIDTAIADGGGDLVLELGQVEFMDASTIGVLIDADAALRRHARALRLRSPSGIGRRLLEVCLLDHLIDTTSDPIARRCR